MKLISCYIENFGSFHQTSFTFTFGLNVFREDNGWGKTTLAAFIKAMLYGLEYRQRSRELYERTRYLPWQGGACGGYLVFGTGGREYKLVRSFGRKSVEDEFSLYDNGSGKPCEDFTERIGEELFGIDRESFERSIFIGAQARPPELSDSLSAKLGNLLDNTDDINNYENACHTLDVLATAIKAKRGPGGRLGELQERLEAIREQLQECEDARTQMDLLQEKIDGCQMQKKELEARRAALHEEMKTLELQGRRQEYERLLERLRAQKAQAGELSAVFGAAIPNEEELDHLMEQARRAQSQSQNLEELLVTGADRRRLQELSSYFGKDISGAKPGYVPDEEELARCSRNLRRCREASVRLAAARPAREEIQEFEELSRRYQKHPPTPKELDRYMEDYTQAVLIREELHNRQLALEQRKTDSGSARFTPAGKLAFLSGGILLAAGLLLLLLLVSGAFSSRIPADNPLPPGGLLPAQESGASTGFLILGGFLILTGASVSTGALFARKRRLKALRRETEETSRNAMDEIRFLKEELSSLEQAYVCFMQEQGYEPEASALPRALSDIRLEVSRYRELDARLQEYHTLKRKLLEETAPLQEACDKLLEPFRIKTPSMDDESLLQQIGEKKQQYLDLDKRIREYDHALALQNTLLQELSRFFDTCRLPEPLSQSASPMARMEFLRDTFRDYRSASRALEDVRRLLKEFEEEYDVTGFKALPDNITTPEKLREKLDLCDREADHIAALDADYRKNQDMQSLIADRQQDLEGEYESLTQQKEELQQKHKLLIKTMNLLQAARERLSTGYLSGTRAAFDKYLALLDTKAPLIRLDTNLNTTVEEYGKLWKSSYFSSGYRDLVNLCTRLALADAMYQGAPPFLILDDPFVNLDEDKLEQALSFLNVLAQHSQIFYFTCHSSRCPD